MRPGWVAAGSILGGVDPQIPPRAGTARCACGRDFYRTPSLHDRCGPCRELARRAARGKWRVCACGAKFFAQDLRQIWCTAKCRYKHRPYKSQIRCLDCAKYMYRGDNPQDGSVCHPCRRVRREGLIPPPPTRRRRRKTSRIARENVVYALLANFANATLVKIGTTVNIETRIEQLRTPKSCKRGYDRDSLTLIHFEPAPPWTELIIHERLAKHQVTGEWFNITPDQATAILKEEASIAQEMLRLRERLLGVKKSDI